MEEYSIEQMDSKMTLYYSKSTGDIKRYCTGINNMDFFGEDTTDFNIIYNFLVVDKDRYVLDNLNKFIIVDSKLKLKEEFKNSIDKYL